MIVLYLTFSLRSDLRHELAAHSKNDEDPKSEKEVEAMEIETQADTKVPKGHKDILQGAPGGGDNIQPCKVATIPLKIETVTPIRSGFPPNPEDITRQRIELGTPGRSKQKYFKCNSRSEYKSWIFKRFFHTCTHTTQSNTNLTIVHMDISKFSKFSR